MLLRVGRHRFIREENVMYRIIGVGFFGGRDGQVDEPMISSETRT
jgi:hypothetical protein